MIVSLQLEFAHEQNAQFYVDSQNFKTNVLIL